MNVKHLLLPALMGGAAFFASPALAGGAIGGNCCADLEERVAELEATTVRKGNRRVSLKISGLIHRSLVFDDGDVSISDQPVQISRLRFSGKAKINSDLYAGYYVELGMDDDGKGWNPNNPNSGLFQFRHNDLYIGSKTFGRLSIGQGSTASDKTAEADLSGTGYVASGSLNNYHILSNLDGFSFTERVKYDSPTIAGFTVSASWQDDEDWDVAAKFGHAFGDFRVAARISYYEESDGDSGVTGSASVLHAPSGLSVTFAAADSSIDTAQNISGNADGLKYWYVKGGIQRKIFSAGKTAFAVDYMSFNDGATDKFGIHAAQYIDAANMQLYISAWDAESDGSLAQLGDDQKVVIGAILHF